MTTHGLLAIFLIPTPRRFGWTGNDLTARLAGRGGVTVRAVALAMVVSCSPLLPRRAVQYSTPDTLREPIGYRYNGVQIGRSWPPAYCIR